MFVAGTNSRVRKHRKKKKLVIEIDANKWTEKVAATADKHQVSHRAMTEIIAAFVKSGDGDLNDMSLSKDTIQRHRNNIREEKAKEIWQKNTQDHNSSNSSITG